MTTPAGDWLKVFDPALGTPTSQQWQESTYFNVNAPDDYNSGAVYSGQVTAAPYDGGRNLETRVFEYSPAMMKFQVDGDDSTGLIVGGFSHSFGELGKPSNLIQFQAAGDIILAGYGLLSTGFTLGTTHIISSTFYTVAPLYDVMYNLIEFDGSTLYNGVFVPASPNVLSTGGGAGYNDSTGANPYLGQIHWIVIGKSKPTPPPPPPDPPIPPNVAGGGPCNLFIPYKDWADDLSRLAQVKSVKEITSGGGKDFENFKELERWANLIGPMVCTSPCCAETGTCFSATFDHYVGGGDTAVEMWWAVAVENCGVTPDLSGGTFYTSQIPPGNWLIRATLDPVAFGFQINVYDSISFVSYGSGSSASGGSQTLSIFATVPPGKIGVVQVSDSLSAGSFPTSGTLEICCNAF